MSKLYWFIFKLYTKHSQNTNTLVSLLIYILFITHHLLPPPWARYASCHEISYSKRQTKLKKEKKNTFFPLYPLSCRLGHTAFHPHASYSCGNPQLWHLIKVWGHPKGYAPCIPPHSYPAPFSLLA